MASSLAQLVYEDKQYELEQQLLNVKPSVLLTPDVHGNTPFHVAAILGHSTCLNKLLLAFFGFQKDENLIDRYSKLNGLIMRNFNKSGWSIFEECIARGHRGCIGIMVKLLNVYQILVTAESAGNIKKAVKDKFLQKDFELKMKMKLTSWVPFLSRFLPSDEIILKHQNGSFRMDFSISPGDGSPGAVIWKRGQNSVIYHKDAERKFAVLLDHQSKEGFWIIPDNLFQTNQNRAVKSTLNIDTILQDKENIVNWTFSGSITDAIPLSLTKFKFTQKDLDNQINGFLSQPVARPGLSTNKVLFVAGGKNFLGLGQKKSTTYGTFKAENYSVQNLALVIRSRKEHLSAADRAKHNDMKAFNKQLTSGFKVKNYEVSGPEADMFEEPEEIDEETIEEGMRKYDEILKQGFDFRESVFPEKDFARPSYDEYLKIKSTKIHIGHGRSIVAKVKRHPVKGKISLCEDFPIKKESLLGIVEASAPRFRHMERLAEFLNQKMPDGFPVHMDFPIMATVSAQLTVLDLKVYKTDSPLKVQDFCVPTGYSITTGKK